MSDIEQEAETPQHRAAMLLNALAPLPSVERERRLALSLVLAEVALRARPCALPPFMAWHCGKCDRCEALSTIADLREKRA